MAGQRETNILLVEDTEDHAVLMKRALECGRVRTRLFWVTDGQAALDFLYNRAAYADTAVNPRPDVILLDLRLPKIHGLEVLEKIKSDKALRNIPVAVLTASDESKDIIGAYQAGAESFMIKSVVFLNKGECLGTILKAVVSLTGASDKEVVAHGI
jgi:CheY-like chemotaxis protein